MNFKNLTLSNSLLSVFLSSVKTFFLCLFISLSFNLFAQPGRGGQGMSDERIGEVSGTIIDKNTKAPIPFANVVLYRQRDSTIVDGTITNEKGAFNFTKLPFGRFYMQIQYVGYPPFAVDSIFVRPKDFQVKLHDIEMVFSSVALDEVVISGEKSPLQFNLDRKVINIDSDIAASSSTAAEVMQNIPSITVDVDGNVSLRGSSNVIILIDGRPSMLTSLDQLPATMIESVELITNPSARYDPDGTSGMINIVLKKKKDPGYHGMISVNAGTGNKLMSSLNFNYRQNKVNVFLDLNSRFWGMQGYSNFNRHSVINDTNHYFTQKQNFARQGNFGNIRFGTDYFINNKNTIGVMGMVNNRVFFGFEENKYYTYDFNKDLNNHFIQESDGETGGNGYEGAIHYKRTYDNKIQELTADLFYSNSNWNNIFEMQRMYYNTDLMPSGQKDYFQNTYNNTNRENITAQVDYVKPIGTGGRMETGYKYSLSTNIMDYRMLIYDYPSEGWQNNALASNEFKYIENLNSGYLIYSNSIKNIFKYQMGLRAEHVQTNAHQITQDTVYERTYFNLFPSVHLKYEPSQKHNYVLSYSRRVNRPSSRVLNPFINYSDPFNLSMGNPYLDPEFVNSFELGYSLILTKTIINSTAFYRYTDGIVSRVMLLENDGLTSMTTFRNINKEESYGIELILSQELLKWWKINANYSHFRTRLYGEDINENANDNYSWTLKINSTMKLPQKLDIQINFNYNSPQIFTGGMSNYRYFQSAGGLGIMSANYFTDISLRKSVLKDKGTITLRVSDVFKTIKFDVLTYGDNFTSELERRRESRVLYVGFSYRINEYRRPKERKRPDSSNEDMD